MKKLATKKRIAGLIALVLALVLAFNLPQQFVSETKAASGTSSDYGLQDNVQDGVILHAWNWSYDTIKANLADIAAAGYTTIQTSPVQQPKDYNASYVDVKGQWWKLYQPLSFSIASNSWIGNASQLKSLCQAADQYGIKIICDIIANHLANKGGEDLSAILNPNVAKYESELYNNSWKYVRGRIANHDGSVEAVVHGSIGLPDLVTSEVYIQNRIISLLKDCIDCGVDGFRFDAAKHIETPDDGNYASNFWPHVLGTVTSYANSKGTDVYYYGEILNTPGEGRSFSSYTKLMNIVDNKTSNSCTDNVKNGNATGASSSYYYTGQLAKNLVLWAESHDTYNGDWGEDTSGISTSVINRSWAISAARADATALYFARPGSAGMGKMGTTDWKAKEVAAVNKFHNDFVGALEYNSATNSVAVVERYYTKGATNGGAVLVNVNGGGYVSNVTANVLGNGSYKDQVSGNTFTVSGGKVSGQMDGSGIAVLYNAIVPNPDPINTISPEGGTFTDTVTITLGLKNATSGTYQIGNNAQKTYTSQETVTIGSDMEYNESVKVLLTATSGTKTTSASYVFTKVEQSELTSMYFDPSPCYWFGDASAVPAVKFDSDSTYKSMTAVVVDGKEYYTIAIPAGAVKVTVARQLPSGEVYNEHTTNLVEGQTLLTANDDWNSGGVWSKFDQDPIPITETMKIYFSNNYNWNNVYLHYWGSSKPDTTWPGNQMTYVKTNEFNEKVYSIEIPSDVEGIIFSNNSGSQTIDITSGITDGLGYYISGGSGTTLTVGSYTYGN